MRFSTTVLCAALLAATPLAAQSPDATIDRALAAYERMRTARATFEQTLSNPLTGSTMTAKGTVVQQRKPARIAITFTDPKGDRIVSDGSALWIYTPSSAPGQVLKLAPSDGAGTVDVAAQLLESPKTRYTITHAGFATVSGRKTHALTLVPKGASQFARATVWIDLSDGTMRQFEVTEGSGLVRKVRIVKLALNVKVKSSEFTFTPPKGVKIFDQAAMGSR